MEGTGSPLALPRSLLRKGATCCGLCDLDRGGVKETDGGDDGGNATLLGEGTRPRPGGRSEETSAFFCFVTGESSLEIKGS